MFALHETTEKRVCRTAFFALCVAPTLLTAWWIASHYWPGRHGRMSRELGRTLGVHVKLADWREPRPATVRASGMTLSDRASGQSLVDLRRLEMQRGRRSQVHHVDEATIDASQFVLAAGKIEAWLDMLPPEVHEVCCRRIVIKVTSSTAESPPDAAAHQFVLHNVQARIDRDSAGRVRAEAVAFIDEGQHPARTVRLSLAPSTGRAAAKSLTLTTEPSGMAAAILAAVVPGFGRFGEDAVFAGKVQWVFDSGKHQGVVQGRVQQVDLGGLLPAGSPHRLRGGAAIDIAELTWRGDRVERLAGAIVADQAAVSRSLVDAAVTNFRCGRGSEGQPVDGDPSLVAVDVLAVRFDLNSEGLTFWGHCPPEAMMQEGCMAVSGLQPLLVAPQFYNWHVGSLVQTLLAPPSGWLPATREAVELAERLPLPLK